MGNTLQRDTMDAVDFIAILGDNFYDQDGTNSAEFYSRLETPVKTTPLVTMPGNHDYWIFGNPPGDQDRDQFGNGFMQFYGQDTVGASKKSPYDFTKGPPALAASANFFSFYIIGNVGIITYSDAYEYAEN